MNSIRWFHRIDLGNDIITPGECPHTVIEATKRFGMPENLEGQTVLDIGAWDGLFSFEAEARGGKVTAIDTTRDNGGNWGGTKGFSFAKRILGSNVEYFNGNVYELKEYFDPESFNLVLFYGVLYHLKDPIRALKNLYHVTKSTAIIETAFCKDNPNNLPLWEFAHYRNDDPTNYWYPTITGLNAMLRFVGFKITELIYSDDYRITLKAYK